MVPDLIFVSSYYCYVCSIINEFISLTYVISVMYGANSCSIVSIHVNADVKHNTLASQVDLEWFSGSGRVSLPIIYIEIPNQACQYCHALLTGWLMCKAKLRRYGALVFHQPKRAHFTLYFLEPTLFLNGGTTSELSEQGGTLSSFKKLPTLLTTLIFLLLSPLTYTLVLSCLYPSPVPLHSSPPGVDSYPCEVLFYSHWSQLHSGWSVSHCATVASQLMYK